MVLLSVHMAYLLAFSLVNKYMANVQCAYTGVWKSCIVTVHVVCSK